MKPDYRNWMPRGMIMGLGTATGVLAAEARLQSDHGCPGTGRQSILPEQSWAWAPWDVPRGAGARTPGRCFPYEGGRQLSRQIIRGRRLATLNLRRAAAWDVGQRRDHRQCQTEPQGPHGGTDRWGVEYASCRNL